LSQEGSKTRPARGKKQAKHGSEATRVSKLKGEAVRRRKAGKTAGKVKLIEQRAKFFDAARQHTPMVAVETSSGVFLLSTQDEHIAKSLFSKCDRGEMRVLRRGMAVLERAGKAATARSGTFVDVGANIGTTTVPALFSNGFERAVALEPEPRNLKMLRINVAINGLSDRVQTLPVGASNAPGTARLVVTEHRSGVHEIATAGDEKTDRMIEIELVTVDDLVERKVIQDDGTGMIWIDTEGHDAHVLAGAQRLLAKGVPVILEISPDKLEKQGGTELLLETTQRHFTNFVDMRRVRGDFDSPGAIEFRAQPVARLGDLVGKYASASASHTELLFFADG
jgi:FkbM family methyltransferase